MNILILVFFRALSGGLHENVRATILHLQKAGHPCTLMCRDGEFAEQIRKAGVRVVTTDFSDESNARAMSELSFLHSKAPFSLIHTHPFGSRVIGQTLAKQWNCPLVTTIHGKYTDKLEENYQDFSAIFAVSSGIRDYLIAEVGADIAPKIMVFPNAADLERFQPEEHYGQKAEVDVTDVRITLATRLDKDKRFILDAFSEAIEYLATKNPNLKVSLIIAGQGTEQTTFISDLECLIGLERVDFRGWLAGDSLARAYHDSDIVVAPGRCALEAMACGKATIAVGSKAYVGIVNETTWQHGVYTNFGGVGNKEADYHDNAMALDVQYLAESPQMRKRLGRQGRNLVELFYDEKVVNHSIISAYSLLSSTSL